MEQRLLQDMQQQQDKMKQERLQYRHQNEHQYRHQYKRNAQGSAAAGQAGSELSGPDPAQPSIRGLITPATSLQSAQHPGRLLMDAHAVGYQCHGGFVTRLLRPPKHIAAGLHDLLVTRGQKTDHV